MNTQITLGWKTIEGMHFICMAVVPDQGEWIEFRSERPYADLDELKQAIEALASSMFPSVFIESAQDGMRTIN